MTPDLRRRVAEAKGWRFEPADTLRYPTCNVTHPTEPSHNGNYMMYPYDPTGRIDWMRDCGIPAWDTSIAAAWELVEEMDAAYVAVRLSNKGMHGYWWAYVEDVTVQATTAPEAICLAYLAWKKERTK